MAYAEHIESPRGNYWRGKYKGPDGRYLSVRDEHGTVIRFPSKRKAEKAGDAEEAAVAEGRWKPPAPDMLFREWASTWYAGLDLKPTTMANIRVHLETHLIPFFGETEMRDLGVQEAGKPLIAKWKDREKAAGYSLNSIRTWHATLHTCLEDARDAKVIGVNPATSKQGRGQRTGGSRRAVMQEERVITSPLGVLLIAERMGILSGRDAELVMVMTAYAGALRLGELIGLGVSSLRTGDVNPRSALRKVRGELRDEALRVEWQLPEVEGKLLRQPPKYGSTGDVDLPPYLAWMLQEHLAATALDERGERERCPCHGVAHVFRGLGSPTGKPLVPLRVVAELAGVSDETVRSALYGRRVSDATRLKVQAAAQAAGWVRPERQDSPAWHWRQSSFEGLFTGAASGWLPPKAPQPRRPVPLEGEWPGTRLRGRAVSRASLRWDPVAEGMTPHGLRHACKARMEEYGIPEIASEGHLRHEVPGVSGAYRHVTEEMRRKITGMLQGDFEAALDERLAMSPRSPVAMLDRLLAERAEARKPRPVPAVFSRNSPAGGPVMLQVRPQRGPDLRRGDWI